MELTAIETTRNGYRFRSRQEARWSVLLDALGVIYRYELEGFYLGNGVRYLPDFWLEAPGVWLEVKGAKPNEDEVLKATLLAQQGGDPVVMFWNQFTPSSFYEDNLTFFTDEWGMFRVTPGIAPLFMGWRVLDHVALGQALAQARGARFEHGESPLTG